MPTPVMSLLQTTIVVYNSYQFKTNLWEEFLFCKFYLIQNSPAVKKVCGPKKAIVKKDVKSKVVAKKWL